MEVKNSYIFWKYAYQKALTQVIQEQCRWSAFCMTVVHLHHRGGKLKRHKRTVGTGKLFGELWTCTHKQNANSHIIISQCLTGLSPRTNFPPLSYEPPPPPPDKKENKTEIFSLWNVCQGVKNLIFSTDKLCVLATVALTTLSLFRQAK